MDTHPYTTSNQQIYKMKERIIFTNKLINILKILRYK